MGAKFRQPPFSVAEANIISKSITVNGTYNASSDNADGYNPVTVNVPESIIVSKSITANGTYNASSDSADGYNPVTVDVYNKYADCIADYSGMSYAFLNNSGNFYSYNIKSNYMKLIPVIANHTYVIFLPQSIGNRYRIGLYNNKNIGDFIEYINNLYPNAPILDCDLGYDLTSAPRCTQYITPTVNGELIVMSSSNYENIEPIIIDIV